MNLGQTNLTAVENQQNFDKLLAWLDEDRESAGQKYNSIHLRLTRIFHARGALIGEELADETIKRVTEKIDFLTKNYVGEPTVYFYGVAKKVFLEFTRKPVAKELPNQLVNQEEAIEDNLEKLDRHLNKCLNKLTSEQSRFILEYYKCDGKEKIKHRKQMAQELGISMHALRVRAFRVRKLLQTQFFQYLEKPNADLKLPKNQTDNPAKAYQSHLVPLN